jgi:hypothetical protein
MPRSLSGFGQAWGLFGIPPIVSRSDPYTLMCLMNRGAPFWILAVAQGLAFGTLSAAEEPVTVPVTVVVVDDGSG